MVLWTKRTFFKIRIGQQSLKTVIKSVQVYQKFPGSTSFCRRISYNVGTYLLGLVNILITSAALF